MADARAARQKQREKLAQLRAAAAELEESLRVEEDVQTEDLIAAMVLLNCHATMFGRSKHRTIWCCGRGGNARSLT